ncbi:MFS transporter [Lentzea sp. NPDC058436]|uniref:MFS transporter n=1 Tax=Lentzea sp. NPDC058436 TaxID=3346499 RepID=UPI00365D459A
MSSAVVAEHQAPARAGSTRTLAAVALATVMLPMAVTGPGVALGELASSVGASAGAAQWVLNSYNIAFTAFMLAAGSLSDLFGRRRALLAGIGVFSLASLVAGVAPSILVVDVARAVQGLGAAAILTSGSAMLAQTFSGAARAKAFGVLGASLGFGLALGPVISGALLAVSNWHAIFLANVVLGVISFVLAWPLGETRDPGAREVDVPGMVLFTAALFLLTFAFLQGPQHGWLSVATLSCLAGSVVALGLFGWVETRVKHPMFDLKLLRRKTFIAVIMQPMSIVFTFAALLVYLPLYFQGAGGLSLAASGAILLPLTLPVLVLPLISGALAARVSPRVLLAASPAILAVALVALTQVRPGGSTAWLVGSLLLAGVGIGLAFGVMDNAAVSVVPPEQSGMASGMFNTIRLTGETLGIAAVGGVLLTLTQGSSSAGPADAVVQGRLETARTTFGDQVAQQAVDAYVSGWHVVFGGMAVLAAAGAAAIYLMVSDRDLAS